MTKEELIKQYCNLNEGKYSLDTKIGKIDVECIHANGKSDFAITSIKINNNLYSEFIYTHFNYIKLIENIYFNDQNNKYKLRHYLNNENKNEIEYTNKENNVYQISQDKIVNKTTQYIIREGIMSNSNSYKNISIEYNLETDEKILLIKKNANSKVSTNESNYVKIHGDIKSFINKYNELITILNSNTNITVENSKIYSNELEKLINTYSIPQIDINEFEKLNNEINEYIKIYKEFSPKLNTYHSKEMIKLLEFILTVINKENIEHNKKATQGKRKLKMYFWNNKN
ncbi:MAG: hypothetical protein E7166_02725 [Firmicutes bacterium]|nr:hypothetical protein [Bacillota bacterium]